MTITLDTDSERVLLYFYEKGGFIGVNQIREYFQLSDERNTSIINQLKSEDFISTNPNYPKGTFSPNAPRNFTPGQLFSITERGINYLKKQGEFKETVNNTYTQTINNSPKAKAQMMNDSPHSRQNIGNHKKSIFSQIINFIRRLLRL